MRNFSYYGLLKIAQVDDKYLKDRDAWVNEQIAAGKNKALGPAKQLIALRRVYDLKQQAAAAKQYGQTTTTPDGRTVTQAHLYRQPDGNYSDKPGYTMNPVDREEFDDFNAEADNREAQLANAGVTKGEFVNGKLVSPSTSVQQPKPQTPAKPSPAPAPVQSTAPQPIPTQQPTEATAQQPGSQPVKTPAQPSAQTQPQQPSYRQQAWNNMDQGQRDAFKNWAKTDGQGGMFGAMFRGADGKVDNAAMDKFLQENPNFLTGSDADRKEIFKKRYGQLTPEQVNAFKQSKDYQNYRQAAAARQKAKQQANQSQVDANVSAYEKNKARLQNIYDNPVEATQQMAAKMYRNGAGGNEAAASTVQAWRDARDQLNNDKGFYSAVDSNGNVVSSAGGKKESYADYVARTSGAGRYNGQRRTNSYSTGGGLPTAVAGRKVNTPKTGITTVAQRGGSPSLYRMKGRTRLYNRG